MFWARHARREACPTNPSPADLANQRPSARDRNERGVSDVLETAAAARSDHESLTLSPRVGPLTSPSRQTSHPATPMLSPRAPIPSSREAFVMRHPCGPASPSRRASSCGAPIPAAQPSRPTTVSEECSREKSAATSTQWNTRYPPRCHPAPARSPRDAHDAKNRSRSACRCQACARARRSMTARVDI
jgi:hypothetical protein